MRARAIHMMNRLLRWFKLQPFYKRVQQKLNNQHERDQFIIERLGRLPANSRLLDAGCGSQRYREYCGHLVYKGQDFAQYMTDEKQVLSNQGQVSQSVYPYGEIDYVGDVWNIEADDGAFDVILCTEVFEHIPYPNETVR